ncbi:MAG: hypothetical protein ACI88H_002159 [Cocleimonas sp.]|jgi:hypothetical protein
MKFIQLSDSQVLINNNINLISSIKNSPKTWAFLALRLSSKFALFLVLIATLYPLQYAHAIESQQVPQVQKVISAFQQNNRVAISKLVSYPLIRPAPLPPIRNEAELLKRYDEVFDRTLLQTITQSNLYTDWDSIGWRGVILNNGIVALDPDGNITEIKYHSPREQAIINQLRSRNLAKGRSSLHRSVKDYNQSVVQLTTPRFHIRIDNVGGGNGKLRYTSWPINKNLSDKPDLVLNNGRFFDSNGRNQRYIFVNGTYSYQLNIQSLNANAMPTGSLEVYKDGKRLTREVATIRR